MLGQWLIQVVAQVPAMGQIQAGHLHQLPFGANALEEHDELELEEDHWIDGRPPGGLVVAADELAHEAEVQLGLKVPIEVITRNQGLERDQDRTIESAAL